MEIITMSITNTCGTCKFKGKLIKESHKYFFCDRIKHDVDRRFKPGHKAVIVDGSGYYAALCVEDDFGCLEWKAT